MAAAVLCSLAVSGNCTRNLRTLVSGAKTVEQRGKRALSVLALLPDFLAALSCFSNFSAALLTSFRFSSHIGPRATTYNSTWLSVWELMLRI